MDVKKMAGWRELAADYRALCRRLGDPAILRCPNRQGLRLQTGGLLEDAFLTLAAGCDPDLAVEIGAHEASFLLRMKQARPEVPAIAFEANPHVFEHFQTLPDFAERGIDYRHAAISAATGTAAFHIPTRWPRGTFKEVNRISSLAPRADTAFEHRTVQVPAYTLDDALAPLAFSNAVLWIDVEGGQREVLAGAAACLARTSALFLEVETKEVWAGQSVEGELTRLLESRGFVPVLRDAVSADQFNQIYLSTARAGHDIAAAVVRDYVGRIDAVIAAAGTASGTAGPGRS